MSVFTLTSTDAENGTRKRAQRRSEWLSSSRNSVSVHIVTMIAVMKCLSVLKPLSIQLQKCDSDTYNACTQVGSVKSDLKAIREQRNVHFSR